MLHPNFRLLRCRWRNRISPTCAVASLWVYHLSRIYAYPSGCWIWVSNFGRNVCICLSIFCVSVSDRCVGSGLQSCWHCGLALLSPGGRRGPRRSRSAGTAPGRGCLSCDGVCTPGPLSARAYRCETRSVWRSTDSLSSRLIWDKCPLPGLWRRQQHGMRIWNVFSQRHQRWNCWTVCSPFTAWGWWLWVDGGLFAWCSTVLFCFCTSVMTAASAPSTSLAWQTPKMARKNKPR